MGADASKQLIALLNERAEIDSKLELLLRTQAWSRNQLDSWCGERLTEAIDAARRTEFWRERIEPGQKLESLEPLDRETLRSSFERIRAPGDSPRIRRRTSGSTGRPVELEHGPGQIGFAAAARLRQLSWFGLPAEELPTANIPPAGSTTDPVIVRGREDPVEFAVNHWALDERTLEIAHRQIVGAGGVRLIGGSTSMLEHWAQLYLEHQLDGSELGVDLAIVGGEMTYPEQRRRIEDAFGCRTANMYGSWEALMMALECPEGTLHVSEEVVSLEVLREDGSTAAPGEFGDVVVTLLHNPEFSLIRYLVGDVARRVGGCSCGRPQIALDLDLARREDMISCSDGRRLHPRVIRSVLERQLGSRLGSFHTVQEGIGTFRCTITAEGPIPGRLEALVEAELRTGMEEDIGVEVVASSHAEVERLRNGKLRTFTNRVSRQAGAGHEA